MKFEFVLILSLLSYLSNSASLKNAQMNNITNETIIMNAKTLPTLPNIQVLSCYVDEFSFDNLDAKKVLNKLKDDINKYSFDADNFRYSNSSGGINNTLCGLLISKNNNLNKYNFNYGFFNTTDCVAKSDIICNDGNCSESAIKCCKPGVCNLYDIALTEGESCSKNNKTRCFKIQEAKSDATTVVKLYIAPILIMLANVLAKF